MSLPPSPDTVVALLGALAYGELTGFTHLAGDSAQAPSTEVRVALARLAAEEVKGFEALEAELAGRGVDVQDAMAPFVADFDTFHARTRPRTWSERLVRACVGDGLTTDFYRELVACLPGSERALLEGVLRSETKTALVERELAEVLRAQPTLSGRLSLYARRIVGEAVAQAHTVLLAHPDLAGLLVEQGEPEQVRQMLHRLTDSQVERMTRLGLTP